MKYRPSAEIGRFDEKGHWAPIEPIHYSPLFSWPIKPLAILNSIFGWGGFIFPLNFLLVLIGFLTYYVFQPDFSRCQTFKFDWIALIFLRNLIYLWIVYGTFHFVLYIKKMHGSDRKYHPEWEPVNTKNFTFKRQVWDNIFWSNVSGLTVWTAYEVLYTWLAANGRLPMVSFKENPVWFIALFFIVVLFREVHFYLIHRLIHWGPLFRYIHSLHHRNHSVAPWSGMSMHPIEHLIYFSSVLIHFVLPSNPVHFFFHTAHLALMPVNSHTGFEGPLFKGKLPVGSYSHYLHHKYVNCNFGGDFIPLDKWFGKFYDGTGKFKFTRKKALPKS